MKKIIASIMWFFMLSTFVLAQTTWTGANDNQTADIVPVNTSIEANTDIDNTYYYFYGEWCSYCIILDQFFQANDIYEKFDVESFEIWNDRDNAVKMSEYLEKLWIPVEKSGTPFVVVNPNAENMYDLNWLTQIQNHFEELLSQRWDEIKEYEEPTAKKIVNYVLMALFFWIIIMGIVYYNKK